MNNKKGSITIFLCMFFVSLVFMIMTFAGHAKDKAIESSIKSLGYVWAQSILGEYNKELLDRYSIYGFYGDGREIKNKLNYYANYSFKDKNYIKYSGCDVRFRDYSLMNTDIFKKQIIDVAKTKMVDKILKPEKVFSKNGNCVGIINNQKILNGLPSKDFQGGVDIKKIADSIKGRSSIGDILKKSGDALFINTYINNLFKDASNDKNLGDTFFNNEEEYIICGKKSDEENMSGVKWRIVGIREILNSGFLLKDPQKSAELKAAALLITPGPEALITEKILLAAWAFAESINDYKLLANGKRVPLIKSSMSWAIDLDSIINNKSEEYVDTGLNEGDTYSDYLNMMLLFIDEDIKLLRIMDLIQINMRCMVDKNFQLSDYYTGVDISLNVNGESYEISKSLYK